MATLLDIAKLNGNDAVVGLIEENLQYAPELSLFPSRTIKGTSFKTGTRTGVPSLAFRSANEGVTPGRSTYRDEIVQCFIVDMQIEVDKAIALAYEDGLEAYQALEASGVMKGCMQGLGSQIWYGTSNSAKGFPGLKDFTPKADANVFVNATGSTASTASSAYLVKFGPQFVQLLFGRDTVLELGDWREQQVDDGSGKKFTGLVNALTGWTGLQIVNKAAVVRIGNLTEDSGKGLTDGLIAEALSKFPVGVVPDAIFCSRRSRMQLQKSRTATTIAALGGSRRTSDGLDFAAPIPTESHGIQLIATDSIRNDDAVES